MIVKCYFANREIVNGGRGGIRTPDLRLRRPVPYPG